MIISILLIGIVLRFFKINQSLWLDEAINVTAVKALGFRELALQYSLGDFHPPLYHILLKVWLQFFPAIEVLARIPSIIFGVANIFVTYLIAKELYDMKTALIAALLLATAPLHVYYSQEARMYMLAALLGSLSIYFFIKIIKKENIFLWTGFILSTALMLYADYLPYLLIPAYLTYLFVFRKNIAKSTLISFIPAFLLIFIILTPWFVIFPKQFTTGLSAAAASPAWAQVVGSPNVKNLLITFVKFTIGRISYENNLVYAILFSPIALFVVFLVCLSFFRLSRERSFLWFWFIIPLALAFVIAFFIPVFAYFRFIFILPAFYIIWASAINTLNLKKSIKVLLFIALAINIVSLSIYFIDPKFQREDWKSATAYVHNTVSQNSIVLFESASSVSSFDYYNKKMVEAAGALGGFNAERSKVIEKVAELTRSKEQVFLFQYLSGITDQQGILFEELTNVGFKNVATYDFNGVGFVYEFKR